MALGTVGGAGSRVMRPVSQAQHCCLGVSFSKLLRSAFTVE